MEIQDGHQDGRHLEPHGTIFVLGNIDIRLVDPSTMTKK